MSEVVQMGGGAVSSAAGMLGMLIGSMIDPVIWGLALAIAIGMRPRPLWLKIVVVVVTVSAIGALIYASDNFLTLEQKTRGLILGAGGAVIWMLVFAGVIRLFRRKTP